MLPRNSGWRHCRPASAPVQRGLCIVIMYLPNPVTRPVPFRLARLADRFGATASFVCAAHCAALPLVIAALPALGLGFLADHGIERGFVAFATVLALVSLVSGYRRHRRTRAFWFVVPGVLLLVGGIAMDADGAPLAHALLVSLGGTLVAISHLTNLRLGLGPAHVHDAACSH